MTRATQACAILLIGCAGILQNQVPAHAAILSACHLYGRFPVPLRCFPPRRVSVAEHLMPLPPIRPTSIVWRAVRLRLNSVLVRLPKKPLGITYLYGRVPQEAGGYPDYGSRRFSYVVIDEGVTRATMPHPRLFRDTTELNGFYWVYAGNFRCRLWHLEVTSNLPPATVRGIGRAILGKETCGK